MTNTLRITGRGRSRHGTLAPSSRPALQRLLAGAVGAERVPGRLYRIVRVEDGVWICEPATPPTAEEGAKQ